MLLSSLPPCMLRAWLLICKCLIEGGKRNSCDFLRVSQSPEITLLGEGTCHKLPQTSSTEASPLVNTRLPQVCFTTAGQVASASFGANFDI